ncbi:MAG TPA: S1C family serine protease [Actinoplanes sp.]|nr:S1C family serine protease [Actinoplanes sp.]
MRPAPDPWETGERIFGIQWNTGEQRALNAEWEAGQRVLHQRRDRPVQRHIGHPRPARAMPPPAYALAPAPEPAAGRTGRTRLATALIVVALVLVAGWQTWRLDRDNDHLAAVLATERDRAAALDQRTEKLEQQLAGVFDPEAISSSVLPSVFRVRAGGFTGTAFAIGDQAGRGQVNLLTNFHVVEGVWKSGDRSVTLERGGDRIPASIVKVSRGKDLALLRAARDVKGLRPSTVEVKPGQQILVVGAPLGLEDSVTTGVVSAYRPGDADGQSIQFDAPINPGNSGGPVVNASDEVVGLATAKARDAEGIGLAVSIKTACQTFKVC